MAQETPHLLPLAEESFALEEVLYPVVDGLRAGERTGIRRHSIAKVWSSQVEIF